MCGMSTDTNACHSAVDVDVKHMVVDLNQQLLFSHLATGGQ